MNKPIFLIGGTAGTGKTTLARELSYHLNLDHRLGTGFIREIIRSETSENLEPHLFKFTFQGDNTIANLREQSVRLYPAILNCIKRARTEGTSLIIEGNHLLPELYSLDLVDEFYILKPTSKHKQMLLGSSHTNRTITDDDLNKIKFIDDYLRHECKQHSIPYMFAEECQKLIYSKYGVNNESKREK